MPVKIILKEREMSVLKETLLSQTVIDTTLYHISVSKKLKVLNPSTPNTKRLVEDTWEELTTKRISFSDSIDGCILGKMFSAEELKGGLEIQVYALVPSLHDVDHYSNNTLNELGLVFDSHVTGEYWLLEDVKVRRVCTMTLTDKVRAVLEYAPNVRNFKVSDKYLKSNGKLDNTLWDKTLHAL